MLSTIGDVGWTFFFIMIVLKIPILLLMWLVWWSTRPVEDAAPGGDDDGGLRVGGHGHPMHPRPPLPHTPRRGPHGERPLPSPRRVRSVVARSREHA